MKIKPTLLFLLILFPILPGLSYGQADWNNLKTDHFIVFYKPGHEFEAWRALRSLESARPMVEKLTGNSHPPLTAVSIQDAGDFTNGLTDPVDHNILLFTRWPSASIGLPGEDWWSLVGTHEYTHMCHLSQSFGFPDFLVQLYGNFLNPNLELPAWIDEGFAVYAESKLSPTSGRLNDGLFDAYYRVSAQEGRFPSLMKATFAPLEYPWDIMYESGAGFHRYLADTYGEEKFAKFYRDYGTNVLSYLSGLLPFLALDQAAGGSFGDRSIPSLWKDWENSIKAQGGDHKPDGEELSRSGWNLDALRLSNDHLYYQREYTIKTGDYSWFWFHKILERDLGSGKEKELVSTTSSFTAPLRVQGNKLYYAVSEIKEGFANSLSYGYVSLLREKDLTTGKDRALLLEPFRGFDVLADGRILFSMDHPGGFGSDLFLYDPVTRKKELFTTSEYLVDEISIGKNGVVVTAKKEGGSYNLYFLDMEKKTLEPLAPSPFLERHPQWAGNKVIFNANFGREYSLYEYDRSSRKLSRLTSKGFAAWPAYDDTKGQIYFAGLNSGGFDLYRRSYEPKPYSMPKTEESPRPEETLVESDVKKGDYFDNLGWLVPKALHAPLYEFDASYAWVGLPLAGTDALYQFAYAAFPLYDFKDHRAEIDLAFTNQFFSPWVTNLTYYGINEDNLYLQTLYPLWTSLLPGLSNLTVGASLGFQDGLVLEPFLFAGFSYPATRSGLFLEAPLRRVSWGAASDRTSAYANAWILQYLPHSELLVNVFGAYDPQSKGRVLPTLRGYTQYLPGRVGLALSEDYSIPILRIRDGLWNPSLYFQDLVFKVFSDQAFDDQGNRQFSYGAELSLETKLTNSGTGFPTDLGVRVTRNQEGETTVEGFFGFYFFGGVLAKTPLGSGAWKQAPGTPNLVQRENFIERPSNPLFN